MKLLVALLGLAGLALLAFLLAREGWREIALLMATAGWGLALVAAFHVVPMLADTLSWRVLFPHGQRPSIGRLLRFRWVGEAVNSLLPAAQIGGDIVRARLAILQGSPAPLATATVVVDVTSNIFTQAVFTLMGLALLAALAETGGLTGTLLAGVGLALVLFTGFYLVQRMGFFRLLYWVLHKCIGGNVWVALAASGQAFDAAIQSVYKRRRDVVVSCAWTLAAWLLGAGEVWIGMRFLGHPVTLAEAVALESLGQAIKGAVFLVPGALGIQEAGFIGIGRLLGVPPDVAIALSLLKRVRELGLGLPGLVHWQFLEGRRLWQRHRPSG